MEGSTSNTFLKSVSWCLAGFLLLVAGCDNSIDPLDENKGLYSIYGWLDVNAEQNYIRIKELNNTLDEDSVMEGTQVVLQDMQSGMQETLTDTIVQFDSVETHNYIVNMNIKLDRTYKVTMRDDEGREKSSLASTPRKFADVRADNNFARCQSVVLIIFDPVDPETQIEAEIEFEVNQQSVALPNNFPINEPQKNRAILRLNPANRLDKLGYGCDDLTSNKVNINYYHYGAGYEEILQKDSVFTEKFIGLYDSTFTLRLSQSYFEIRESIE